MPRRYNPVMCICYNHGTDAENCPREGQHMCSCHKNPNKCRKVGIHIDISHRYHDSPYIHQCRCNKHHGNMIKKAV